MGVGGRHALAAFTPGEDPVPIVQEAGWAPGLVWIGAENLAPTGIRSPDLPARSESLYQLCYPGPFKFNIQFINFLKEIQKKEEGVDKLEGISDTPSTSKIKVTDQE
jgi:hypothetical protein